MAEWRALDRLLEEGRPAHHPVAVGASGELTFAQFRERVASWHDAFTAKPGVKWALYLEDAAELAAALFGGWQARKVLCLMADAQPATLARIRTEVDGIVGEPARDTPSPAAHDAPGLVVYTSGSSGVPVALPKRPEQLFSEVTALEAQWGRLVGEARILATVSHQHLYGLLFRVLWPLAAGRPFGTHAFKYPEDVQKALGEGPSALVSSPAQLKRLPESLDWPSVRTHLHAVFSSGGPLPLEAAQACHRLLGVAPLEVYGSSETGGVAWREQGQSGTGPWKPLPGVELRIEGETLWVRSPSADSQGRWCQTEDRVRAEPEGFTLLGRRDRIVKLEEKRISLTTLEQALCQSGWIAEARGLMLDGPRSMLAAVAVPTAQGWHLHDTEGKHALNAALRQALQERLEPSALPRRFRYVEALPQDAQGKSSAHSLQALFDLRRPEPRVLERTPEHARVRVEASAQCPYFDGHFPNQPIFPGVAQIEWALQLGRELFLVGEDFAGMEAVKFQQVILPGTALTFELGWQKERLLLSFQIRSASGNHASGRLRFSPRAT